MENKKYAFWEFLKEHKIEIPIIQRDYAQGRLGKEELRRSFLKDLKSALDSNNEMMKLDFVYGTNEDNRFNPLDGQQRLTTLWLFHWYIASSLGMLGLDPKNNDMPNETSKIFYNFTYETRVSSRKFCKELSVFNISQLDSNDSKQRLNVTQLIQNQTWFSSAWKQDPTIDAMLRMLSGTKQDGEIINGDGIEEVLKDCSEEQRKIYWKNLSGDSCPIVFYYLDLVGLNQSDDLYIKMNARGEQLTSFENFKADLIGYINLQSNDSSNNKETQKNWNWKQLLDPINGIPIKMDTTWTNIFWKKRSSDYRIDEIYFAFLNRFFFNELFIAQHNEIYIYKEDENSTQENKNKNYRYLNDSDNPNDYDTKIAYTGLDIYKYDNGEIPFTLFEKLKNILNHYSKYIIDNDIPECSWDKKFHFIPWYDKNDNDNDKEIEIENNAGIKIKKVTVLNQVQRVVFFAVCKYFNDQEPNQESLKRWMRVVWNLVSGEDKNGNPQIRSTSAMRTAIEFIDGLDSHNVYKSLADNYNKYNGGSKTSDFDLGCKEEIEKAKQILYEEERALRTYDGNLTEYKGRTWEDIIIEAENHAFFHGTIRFLFTNEEGKTDWSNFDTKWQNVQNYFDDGGVKDGNGDNEKYKENALLLRKLISTFTEWNQFWEMTYDSSAKSWKTLLTGEKWQTPVHYLLIEIPGTKLELKENYSSLLTEFDEDGQQVQEDLVKTSLLSKIEGGCVLNWRYNLYALYAPNTHADIKKYVIANNRNEILSKFYGGNLNTNNTKERIEGKIYTDQKIEDCDFFGGWRILFDYNNHTFQWDTDKKIYLMCSLDGKWQRAHNQNDQEICINATTVNINNFIQKLNDIITVKNSLFLTVMI